MFIIKAYNILIVEFNYFKYLLMTNAQSEHIKIRHKICLKITFSHNETEINENYNYAAHMQ